jgi:hypothetical protein
MRILIIPLLTGLALILISNIIGHYLAPFSLFVTIVLPFFIITAVNYQLYKKNFLGTVLYGYGIILFNDLLIRLYAGGTHDKAGMALITFCTLLAFIFSTGSMLFFAIRTPIKEEQLSLSRKRLMNILQVLVCAIATATLYNSVLIDK